MLRTLFYSIDLWLRQRLGLGPRRKFVSIYYRISDSAWLLRPMIDVPHKAYMEVRAEEVLLDGNASQDELIRAIHSLIERCHYANDNPSSEGLKGWTQFVQDHLLIVGSINRGSLCFEPWARKNSGHKNGHYVPDHEHAEFCAPSVDIEQAYQALCQARDAANEYDNNAVA